MNIKRSRITLESSFDHLFATYSYSRYWQVGEFLLNIKLWLSYSHQAYGKTKLRRTKFGTETQTSSNLKSIV